MIIRLSGKGQLFLLKKNVPVRQPGFLFIADSVRFGTVCDKFDSICDKCDSSTKALKPTFGSCFIQLLTKILKP